MTSTQYQPDLLSPWVTWWCPEDEIFWDNSKQDNKCWFCGKIGTKKPAPTFTSQYSG